MRRGGFATGIAFAGALFVSLMTSAGALGSPAADETPPTVTITGGPESGTAIDDPSPTFTFEVSEPVVRVRCRFDSEHLRPCDQAGVENASGLADGVHSFAVRATDAAGNVSAPAHRSFKVDTTAPEPTIRGRAVAFTPPHKRKARVPFVVAPGEAGARLECKVDDGFFVRCAQGLFITKRVARGRHNLRVRATDQAGNRGVARKRFSVKKRS